MSKTLAPYEHTLGFVDGRWRLYETKDFLEQQLEKSSDVTLPLDDSISITFYYGLLSGRPIVSVDYGTEEYMNYYNDEAAKVLVYCHKNGKENGEEK